MKPSRLLLFAGVSMLVLNLEIASGQSTLTNKVTALPKNNSASLVSSSIPTLSSLTASVPDLVLVRQKALKMQIEGVVFVQQITTKVAPLAPVSNSNLPLQKQ
jgi:hypothetical protein